LVAVRLERLAQILVDRTRPSFAKEKSLISSSKSSQRHCINMLLGQCGLLRTCTAIVSHDNELYLHEMSMSMCILALKTYWSLVSSLRFLYKHYANEYIHLLLPRLNLHSLGCQTQRRLSKKGSGPRYHSSVNSRSVNLKTNHHASTAINIYVFAPFFKYIPRSL
jgi:hypothetical protein